MTIIRVDGAQVAELGVSLTEVGADFLLMHDPSLERMVLGPGECGPAVEELLGGWRRQRIALGRALGSLGEAAVSAGTVYVDTEAGVKSLFGGAQS